MRRTSRIAIVSLLGALVWIAWMRREASIATTPRVEAPQAQEREQGPGREPEPPSERGGEQEQGREQDPPTAAEPTPPPPSFVLLRVPFVSQAPFRIWDAPYKEFCEEASVYTLHLWKTGRETPPADELDRALKEIQTWEEANLGRWEDTTAEETSRILHERFGYVSARVVRDVTIAMMKAELDAGRPFIVPARGRELPNPYFRRPGPLYHMLVVIGYDDATGEFITNDVGTNTKGAGLRYRYDELYHAMGDWSHEDGAPTRERVMIVMP